MTAAVTIEHPVPAVALSGIDKHFEQLQVLHDVSFSVDQGEIVALLGMSGCGKSTLLNIVSGLLCADGGDLRLFGAPAASFTAWEQVAYMFQEDRLLPWRSVQANVGFGLEGRLDKAERARRVAEALNLVGLTEFAKAWPHQLSGGMRSRAALARSLVGQPRLLLMDEPFSKLDPQTRTQMHEELLRLQVLAGMTILFVTHDVEEAVVLADRVVVLEPRPGRIKALQRLPLPKPRVPTDPVVSEQIRRLRLEL